MRLPLVLIGCVTASAAAFADEPAHLMGDAIKLTFQGSLIELDTPLGTTIPVRFTSDGLVSGESRALAPYLGAVRDRGRWWATEDHLCVKWFRWFDAEQRCLKVQVDGDKMFWREENGETGTATLIGREHTTKVAAAVTPLPLQAPTVPAPALAQGPEIARKPLPLPMFATASVIPTLPMPVQERSIVTPPLAQADDAVPLPKQKPASQTSAQSRSKTVSVEKPRKAPAPDIAIEAPKAAPPSGPSCSGSSASNVATCSTCVTDHRNTTIRSAPFLQTDAAFASSGRAAITGAPSSTVERPDG